MARFAAHEQGASLVEYALLVAALSLVALPAVLSLGESPRDKVCAAAFGVTDDNPEAHSDVYFDEELGRCCRPGVGFGGSICL